MHFPYTSCFLCVNQLIYQMVPLTRQFAWHRWAFFLQTVLASSWLIKEQEPTPHRHPPSTLHHSTLGLFMKHRVVNHFTLPMPLLYLLVFRRTTLNGGTGVIWYSGFTHFIINNSYRLWISIHPTVLLSFHLDSEKEGFLRRWILLMSWIASYLPSFEVAFWSNIPTISCIISLSKKIFCFDTFFFQTVWKALILNKSTKCLRSTGRIDWLKYKKKLENFSVDFIRKYTVYLNYVTFNVEFGTF